MNEKLKFAILSLFVIFFQSILKIGGVLITGSLSFLAETVDTITDIFFVALTIYSIYESQKPPDFEHMYGHKKIDSIGAMIQGIVLINLYILIIYNAFSSFLANSYQVANPSTGLIVIGISFIINIIFSRILIWKGRTKNSLSLEIQGLNLFQDSMRSLLIFVSFIFALFDIIFLDPIFSIVLSIWIIIGALKLTKDGIKDLSDTNPVSQLVVEELRIRIFSLEHVNGVQSIKTRSAGSQLFLDIQLSVEDHISVIHANQITKSIRTLANQFFSNYDVELNVQMDPLSSENTVSDRLINLIYSMKADFPNIIKIKEISLFHIEEGNFLSMNVVVDEELTLNQAHQACTEFENELKIEYSDLNRVITHIEPKKVKKSLFKDEKLCRSINEEEMRNLRKKIEKILEANDYVKGYHGLECWFTPDYCVLELHIFFEGELNMRQVDEQINSLKTKINELELMENLEEIILHSEPLKGRTDGTIFEENKV